MPTQQANPWLEEFDALGSVATPPSEPQPPPEQQNPWLAEFDALAEMPGEPSAEQQAAPTAMPEAPVQQQAPQPVQPHAPFDPEGAGYDYATAREAGLGPDETGHWPSRDPRTGALLKGRQHPTWDLLEQGEREAGNAIRKGEDGRYYSQFDPEGGGYDYDTAESAGIEADEKGMVPLVDENTSQQQPVLQPGDLRRAIRQRPVPPPPIRVQYGEDTVLFPAGTRRETIERALRKDAAKQGTLTFTPSDRSRPWDSDEHAEARAETPLGVEGIVDYAEFLSSKDEQGNPITVEPEEVTPERLEALVAQRREASKRLAADESIDPVRLREFNENTDSMERDVNRRWETETDQEYRARQGSWEADPWAGVPTAAQQPARKATEADTPAGHAEQLPEEERARRYYQSRKRQTEAAKRLQQAQKKAQQAREAKTKADARANFRPAGPGMPIIMSDEDVSAAKKATEEYQRASEELKQASADYQRERKITEQRFRSVSGKYAKPELEAKAIAEATPVATPDDKTIPAETIYQTPDGDILRRAKDGKDKKVTREEALEAARKNEQRALKLAKEYSEIQGGGRVGGAGEKPWMAQEGTSKQVERWVKSVPPHLMPLVQQKYMEMRQGNREALTANDWASSLNMVGRMAMGAGRETEALADSIPYTIEQLTGTEALTGTSDEQKAGMAGMGDIHRESVPLVGEHEYLVGTFIRAAEMAPYMLAAAAAGAWGRAVGAAVGAWGGGASATAAGGARAATLNSALGGTLGKTLGMGVGTRLGAMAGTAPLLFQNAQSDFRHTGIDPEIATPLAAWTAFAESAVESLFIPYLPKIIRAIPRMPRDLSTEALRRMVRREGLKGVARHFVTYAGENMEEHIQGATRAYFRSVGTWLDEQVPDANLGEEIIGELKQAAVVAGPLALTMLPGFFGAGPAAMSRLRGPIREVYGPKVEAEVLGELAEKETVSRTEARAAGVPPDRARSAQERRKAVREKNAEAEKLAETMASVIEGHEAEQQQTAGERGAGAGQAAVSTRDPAEMTREEIEDEQRRLMAPYRKVEKDGAVIQEASIAPGDVAKRNNQLRLALKEGNYQKPAQPAGEGAEAGAGAAPGVPETQQTDEIAEAKERGKRSKRIRDRVDAGEDIDAALQAEGIKQGTPEYEQKKHALSERRRLVGKKYDDGMAYEVIGYEADEGATAPRGDDTDVEYIKNTQAVKGQKTIIIVGYRRATDAELEKRRARLESEQEQFGTEDIDPEEAELLGFELRDGKYVRKEPQVAEARVEPEAAPQEAAEAPGTPPEAPGQTQQEQTYEQQRDEVIAKLERAGIKVKARTPRDGDEQEMLDFLESRGKRASFVDGPETFGGVHHRKSGFILLNRSGNASATDLWELVGHEVAHETGLDKLIPSDSQELADARQEYLRRISGNEKLRKEIEADPERLDREARATLVGKLLRDKKFRDRLSKSNPTLWERLRDFILRIVGDWNPSDQAKAMVLAELRNPPRRGRKAPGTPTEAAAGKQAPEATSAAGSQQEAAQGQESGRKATPTEIAQRVIDSGKPGALGEELKKAGYKVGSKEYREARKQAMAESTRLRAEAEASKPENLAARAAKGEDVERPEGVSPARWRAMVKAKAKQLGRKPPKWTEAEAEPKQGEKPEADKWEQRRAELQQQTVADLTERAAAIGMRNIGKNKAALIARIIKQEQASDVGETTSDAEMLDDVLANIRRAAPGDVDSYEAQLASGFLWEQAPALRQHEGRIRDALVQRRNELTERESESEAKQAAADKEKADRKAAKGRGKKIGVSDSALETIDGMSVRIASIDRQIEKLEAVKRPRDWDKHRAKLRKLNERKDALWTRRAKLIRERDKQPAKPAPVQKKSVKKAPAKQPWEMTREEYRSTGAAHEQPAVYEKITENEGRDAADIVYALHNKGVPTADTHRDGDRITLNIIAVTDAADRARQSGLYVKEAYVEQGLTKQWLIRGDADSLAAFVDSLPTYNEMTDDARDEFADETDAIHRAHTERAISENKPVPAEVLADYPDLQPQKPGEGKEAAPVSREQRIREVMATFNLERDFGPEEARKIAQVAILLHDATGIPFDRIDVAPPGTEVPEGGLFHSAYHGSPYQFDRFTLKYIGTGEGAQAYGWGLYFADSEAVARWYKEAAAGRTDASFSQIGPLSEADTAVLPGWIQGRLANATPAEGRRAAQDLLNEFRERIRKSEEAVQAKEGQWWMKQSNLAGLRKIEAVLARASRADDFSATPRGRVYKVDLAPSQDEYLLWDKPLSEQSEKVKAALKRIVPGDVPDHVRTRIFGAVNASEALVQKYQKQLDAIKAKKDRLANAEEFDRAAYDALERQQSSVVDSLHSDGLLTVGTVDGLQVQADDTRGQWAYRELAKSRGISEAPADRWASEYLRSLGIRGIKYLDQASRGQGEGTYNYVIFDDADIVIEQVLFQQRQRDRDDTIKGWTHFIDAAKALVGGTDKADISTWIHEFAHPMRRFLFDRSVPAEDRAGITDEDIDTIEAFSGVTDGVWTTDAEERFVKAWETYWLEGKAPNAELEGLFQKIARWLTGVYGELKQLVTLTPEVRAVFDKVVQRGQIPEGMAPEAETAPAVSPPTSEQQKAALRDRLLRKSKERKETSGTTQPADSIDDAVVQEMGGRRSGDGDTLFQRQEQTEARDARFRELTKTWTPGGDWEAWKQAHPDEYAELEQMRADVLKAQGYTVGPVWHGTDAEFWEFEIPRQGRKGRTRDPNAFVGAHFAEGRMTAERFAEGLYGGETRTGRIVSAYLGIANPLMVGRGGLSEATTRMLDEQYEQARREYDEYSTRRASQPNEALERAVLAGDEAAISAALKDATGTQLYNAIDKAIQAKRDAEEANRPVTEAEIYRIAGLDRDKVFAEWERRKSSIAYAESVGKKLRNALLAAGYDGVFYRNAVEEETGIAGNRNTWIALHPSQIKSAEVAPDDTGRIPQPSEWGDPGNPNILFQADDDIRELASYGATIDESGYDAWAARMREEVGDWSDSDLRAAWKMLGREATPKKPPKTKRASPRKPPVRKPPVRKGRDESPRRARLGAISTPRDVMPPGIGVPPNNIQPQNASTPQGKRLIRKLRKDMKRKRKAVGVRSIEEFLARLVHVLMVTTHSQVSKRKPGAYQPDSHTYFVRSGVDSTTNFHEAGHALMAYLEDSGKFPYGMKKRLVELATWSQENGGAASAKNAHEGMAELLRLWVQSPSSVPSALKQEFERLMQDRIPGVMGGIRDARMAYALHLTRPLLEQHEADNADHPRLDGPRMASDAIAAFYEVALHIVGPSAGAAYFERSVWRNISNAGRTWREFVLHRGRQARRKLQKIARVAFASVKDTPADMKLAHQLTFHAADTSSNALYGTEDTSKGIRVFFNGRELNEVVSQEDRQRLRDAGFDVPETASFGSMLTLHDHSLQDTRDAVGEENWHKFVAYGQMRTVLFRHIERGHDYPGMDRWTPETLERAIKAAEAEHKDWQDHYKAVQKLQDQSLLLDVLSGEHTPDEVIAMKAAHEDYWTLPRQMENQQVGSGRSSGANPTSGIRHAWGSTDPIKYTPDAIEQKIRRAVQAYYDMGAKRAMLRFQEAMRGSNDWNALPFSAKAYINSLMVPLAMDHTVAATLSQRELQEMAAEAINTHYGEDVVTPDDVELDKASQPIFRLRAPRMGNVLSLFDPRSPGRRQYYYVPDRTLFLLNAGNDSSGATGWLTKIFTAGAEVTQPWKRLITRSLRFAAGNAARDAITGVALADYPELLVPGYSHAVGVIHELLGSEASERMATETLARAQRGTTNDQHKGVVASFKAMIQEGIVVPGYGDMTWRQRLWKLPGQVASINRKLGDVFNWVTGGYYLSEKTEVSARSGAYHVARTHGASAALAQSVFDRSHGNFIQHSRNRTIAEFMRFTGFGNPAIQIMWQLGELAAHPDPKVRHELFVVKGAVVAGTAATAAALNVLLWSMGDDDEYKDRIREEKNRSSWDRMRYATIGPFKIPFEYGPVGAIQSAAYNVTMDYLIGHDTDLDVLAKSILQKAGDMPQLVPPHARLLAEVHLNYSFFYDRPVVDHMLQTVYPDVPYLQAYTDTPSLYKRAGELMNVSPETIRYSVRGLFSSLGDDAVATASRISDGKRWQEWLGDEPADAPAVGRLLRREPRGLHSQPVKDVREAADRVKAIKAMITDARRRGVSSKRLQPLREEMYQLEAAAVLYKEIEQIWRESKALREAGEEEDAKQREREMTEIAVGFYRVMGHKRDPWTDRSLYTHELVRDAMKKAILKRLKGAYGSHVSQGPTESEQVFRNRRKKWMMARQEDQRWLYDHRNTRLVGEVLRDAGFRPEQVDEPTSGPLTHEQAQKLLVQYYRRPGADGKPRRSKSGTILTERDDRTGRGYDESYLERAKALARIYGAKDEDEAIEAFWKFRQSQSFNKYDEQWIQNAYQ